MKILGDILRNGRERLSLTQDQAAQLLDIQRKTYSTYESGRSEPKLELLIKMSSALKIEKEIIFLFTEQSVPGEVSSILQVPGPEASLLQLLLAQKELQTSLEELEKRIATALDEAKGKVQSDLTTLPRNKDILFDKGRNDKGGSGGSGT